VSNSVSATAYYCAGTRMLDALRPDSLLNDSFAARFMGDDGRLIFEYVRVDPETGHEVTKVATARHDATTGVVDLTSIYEEGRPGQPPVRWIRRDTLRLVGADELRAHVEDAGLVVEQLAGSYDLEPLRAGSERAIVVARRP